MNDLGRKKLTNSLLRRAVHSHMVRACGWNTEIDKLSLSECRVLNDEADLLQRHLERRLA